MRTMDALKTSVILRMNTIQLQEVSLRGTYEMQMCQLSLARFEKIAAGSMCAKSVKLPRQTLDLSTITELVSNL